MYNNGGESLSTCTTGLEEIRSSVTHHGVLVGRVRCAVVLVPSSGGRLSRPAQPQREHRHRPHSLHQRRLRSGPTCLPSSDYLQAVYGRYIDHRATLISARTGRYYPLTDPTVLCPLPLDPAHAFRKAE